MRKILITGATGNIGLEVIQAICTIDKESEIIAGVRNIESAKNKLPSFSNLKFRQFDFENQDTFKTAFEDIDTLFLLRPPHISEVEKYFKPLLIAVKEQGINQVVFLSVQGAEKSKVIPHNKIERLIKTLGFDYIFVRPSYFMQNLTTTLLPEIIKSQSITLPSGQAKFNWVDTKNIGKAAAELIKNFTSYQNQAFEITGNQNLSFKEVTDSMSEIIGKKFTFKSLNPICFYFKKKNEGVASGFAMVMTILHFLPRFQNEPEISNNYKMVTGKESTTLKEFILREQIKFTG